MPRSSENRRHYHVDAVEDLIRAAVMVSYPTFTRARPAWQLVAAEQREHPDRFHRVRACYDTTSPTTSQEGAA